MRHVTTSISVCSSFLLTKILSFLLRLVEPGEEDVNHEDDVTDCATPHVGQHTPTDCSPRVGGGCGGDHSSSRPQARPVLYPKEEVEDTAPGPMEGLADVLVNAVSTYVVLLTS